MILPGWLLYKCYSYTVFLFFLFWMKIYHNVFQRIKTVNWLQLEESSYSLGSSSQTWGDLLFTFGKNNEHTQEGRESSPQTEQVGVRCKGLGLSSRNKAMRFGFTLLSKLDFPPFGLVSCSNPSRGNCRNPDLGEGWLTEWVLKRANLIFIIFRNGLLRSEQTICPWC